MVKINDHFPRSSDGRFDVEACVQRLVERESRLDGGRLRDACCFVQSLSAADQKLLAIGLEFGDLLVDLHLDTDAVCAGILYRCYRGRLADYETLVRVVGRDTSDLTRSVERMASVSLLELSNTPLLSTESRDQVDNVRRMLVALIDDPRVAIVKLAERIVALRRAKDIEVERQRRLAREVLEVFAPLANRLGIWRLKWELEDLAFRYLEPQAYRDIAGMFDGRRTERERQISAIEKSLAQALRAEGVEAEVTGRAKHIYSIWRKMHSKNVGFDEIYDVRAVRVLVDRTRDCYAALGVIHTNWRHVPTEFDDYVANPKDNGYRSIHTAVLGPDGKTLEVQIRTREMHRESELGVCAHWSYKDGAPVVSGEGAYGEKLDWLRQVLEWHEEVGGFAALGEELRSDIEQDRIYVFTPRGHVVDLTAGATPLDFAYRVHTEIGHHCAGARVNGEAVALTTALSTGQRVEIVTSEAPCPSRDWLDPSLGYVRTARARAKIQSWFRAQDAEQNIAAGKGLLARELDRLAVRADVEDIGRQLGYDNVDDLYYGLGVGERTVLGVVGMIEETAEQLDLLSERVSVDADSRRLPPTRRRTYRLAVRGHDRPGLLHDITAVVLADDVSMDAMQATSDPGSNTASIAFDVQTDGLSGLARIIDRMCRVRGIIEARRVG